MVRRSRRRQVTEADIRRLLSQDSLELDCSLFERMRCLAAKASQHIAHRKNQSFSVEVDQAKDSPAYRYSRC